tara:strand:- start:784 stop:954 length:171 start_codon:yes stop_codon:yes gene_type:complete
MKFNIITALWTLAIMLMSFNISILFIDWEFTTTLLYHLSVLMNGFIFGAVFNEWSR